MPKSRKLTVLGCLAFLAAAIVMLAAARAADGPAGDSCLTCHTDADYLPGDFMADDIHLQVGLSCAGCHGGDPEAEDQDAAMAPSAGFVGVPSRGEMPKFCGKCHSDIEIMRAYRPRIPTDQVQQYWTSQHGIELAAGNQKVAVCTDCHGTHNVLPAGDTRSPVHPFNVPETCNHCHGDPVHMAGSGLPTDQFEKFKRSVHGVALLENQDTGSPACNDCHGNHGAAPPEISSVAQICGQCHVNNMQYFSDSNMGRAWEEEGFHSCQECHGNHEVRRATVEMVGTGEQSVCINCHGEGDEGFAVAGELNSLLVGLERAYDEAEKQRAEVARVGMEDEEIGFLLQEAHQDFIQARTLVHTFDPVKVAEKTKQGVEKASDALAMGIEQIKEYHHRRRGFGLATLFITILVVALFFKIRQIEGR